MQQVAWKQKITGVVINRITRISIVAGSLGSVYGMIVTGAFQAGFARALGLTDVQFGYMAAIPLLAFPARLASSFVVERLGRKKPFFSVANILSRLVWIAILLLPFLFTQPSPFRSNVFLLLLLVSSTLGSMADPLWYAWLGDLIPEQLQAKFWTKRSIWISLYSILPSIIVALLMDTLKEAVLASPFLPFAVIFAFASFMGVMDIVMHLRVPEPGTRKKSEPEKLGPMLLEPLRNERYRPYLTFRPFWEFALTLMGPFGTLYLLRVLEGSSFRFQLFGQTVLASEYSIIALLTGLQILVSVVTYPVWGTLLERYGSKPVLKLSTLFIAFTPLLWLSITPNHYVLPCIALFILIGASFSGLNLGIVRLLISIAPERHRSMYIAMDLTITSFVGALGPILAGYFMQFVGSRSFNIITYSVGGFQLLCLATFVFRMYARTLLQGVQEGAKISTGYVFRRITEANPLRVFTNIYALSAPVSERKKIDLVSRLGDTRSRLVTRELIEHLSDPSPEVREEAIIALAKSKDPEAVEALLAKLRSPQYGLQEQSARALGRIGDRRSVPTLIDSLSDPDAGVRASAARALGEIGDWRAREPLLQKLNSEKEEYPFSAYATALSSLGELTAIWHILPVMRSTQSLVFRRQLAVAIGNLLGEPHVFYGYLDEETKVFGRKVERTLARLRRMLERRSGNPVYGQRKRLQELLRQAERAYLGEDWPACSERLAEVALVMCDAYLESVLEDLQVRDRQAVMKSDPYMKINMVIDQEQKLGLQLWFVQVLRVGGETPEEKLTFEGCLLAIYVLELIFHRLLGPPRRGERVRENGPARGGPPVGNDPGEVAHPPGDAQGTRCVPARPATLSSALSREVMTASRPLQWAKRAAASTLGPIEPARKCPSAR
jgi:HEAT repeat protein/MFS family permease